MFRLSHHNRNQAPFLFWHIAGYCIFAISLGSIMVSGFFINQYLYQTLDEANSIVVLRSGPDIDSIDMDAYQKSLAIVAAKNATTTVHIERNIFLLGPVAVSTTTPTSSRH